MSAVDADVPSQDWGSDERCLRRLRARRTRPSGPARADRVHKFRGEGQKTGAIIAAHRGLATEEHAGFGEVQRPWHSGDNASYRETAAGYIAGNSIPEWELRNRVRSGFKTAADHALDRSGHGDIVIATHGMSPTIFLASKLDLDTNELTHLFTGGIIPE